MKKRNWAEYLKKVIGWSAPLTATISSIWTPAQASGSSDALPAMRMPSDKVQPITFSIPNRIDGPDLFAGHRSHSSHQSHSSHSSHYSSSGGSYYPSTPSYPTLPPSPALTPSPSETYKPQTPSSEPPKTQQRVPSTPGSTPPVQRAARGEAIYMAMRVQLELTRLGYYSGVVHGKIDAETHAALRAFQRAQGLPETGTMDNATLSKLGITYSSIDSRENEALTMKTQRTKEEKKFDPDVRASAFYLIHDYEENATAADARYKGKIIELSGSVESVQKNTGGGIVVVLAGEVEAGDTLHPVQCSLAGTGTDTAKRYTDVNMRRAATLYKGQTVTLRGKGMGREGNGFVVTHCVFVGQKE